MHRPSLRLGPAVELCRLALVVSIACLLANCSPDSQLDHSLTSEQEPSLPVASGEPGLMDGGWWALSDELPNRGIRLELQAEDDPHAWSGSWLSFDWRSSESAEELIRASLPVAMTVRAEQQELIITGPAPQLDESGTPNGQRGRWELRLRLVSAVGQPPEYAGLMKSSETPDAPGVKVRLKRTFTSWSS